MLNARLSAGKSRWEAQVADDNPFYWTLPLLATSDCLFWPLQVHVFVPQTFIYLTDLSAYSNQIVHTCHKHTQQWAYTQASIRTCAHTHTQLSTPCLLPSVKLNTTSLISSGRTLVLCPVSLYCQLDTVVMLPVKNMDMNNLSEGDTLRAM